MSVKTVKSISIIGMMSDLDEVIQFCGDSCSFQPDDAMSFYSDTKNFVPLNDKNPYAQPITQLKNACELGGFPLSYAQEPSSQSADALLAYVNQFVDRTEEIVSRKLLLEQSIDECQRAIEQVEHFTGCDIDFTEINNCQYITPNFGRLPKESYEKLSAYSSNHYAIFFPFSNDDTHYWGAYFTIPEQKNEIDRIFSSLFFERLEVPPIAGKPDDYMKSLQTKQQALRDELTQEQEKLSTFWEKEKQQCLATYTKLDELNSYNEIKRYAYRYDPTTFVALTYTLFFGIMFGDVGQGFVVALIGAIMYKFKKMEIGRILVPCGIMGMIFGFLYGSVFGFEDLLTPVHQALFGTKGKLIEVMEPESINIIIYGSVAIGIVTIALAMIVNIVSSLKRRDYESAFFGANGLSGFVLYVSLVAGLVCQMLLGIKIMNIAYILGLIVVPLILMFLR